MLTAEQCRTLAGSRETHHTVLPEARPGGPYASGHLTCIVNHTDGCFHPQMVLLNLLPEGDDAYVGRLVNRAYLA